MADLSDVEDSLVSVVTGALYPSGTGAASVLGVDCRVYRGWPDSATLKADLSAGKVNVSVYAQPNVERNTTRFPADWKTLTPQAPLITLAVAGNVVTVGGGIQAGDIATIKVAERQAYSVSVQAAQTIAAVAVALLALVQVDYPAATLNGAAITIPTGAAIAVAIGGLGTSWRELRRQRKGFQVTVWASTPAQRDQAGKAVDAAFAAVELSGFLTLADGSAARLEYSITRETDSTQKEVLYRRDLFYFVEFPTTDTRQDPSITAVVENVKGSGSPPDAPAVTTIL